MLNRLLYELQATLFYHNFRHTESVMTAAMIIADAEAISEEEKKLLRIAVAFHDSGFLYVYRDHEYKSCELAGEILPGFNFTPSQIDIINGMIMATRIPQQPKTQLERIIADADLDYLGRENAGPVARNLWRELQVHAGLGDENAWNTIQIEFIKAHRYHTEFSKREREPAKQRYLNSLLAESL